MVQARDRLLSIAKSPSISHAYVLEGRDCQAKDDLAMEFALAITPHRRYFYCGVRRPVDQGQRFRGIQDGL